MRPLMALSTKASPLPSHSQGLSSHLPRYRSITSSIASVLSQTSNGKQLQSTSNMMTPSEKTSLLEVKYLVSLLNISGELQGMVKPGLQASWPEGDRLAHTQGWKDSPKSMSLTTRLGESMMLLGLRSRWTMRLSRSRRTAWTVERRRQSLVKREREGAWLRRQALRLSQGMQSRATALPSGLGLLMKRQYLGRKTLETLRILLRISTQWAFLLNPPSSSSSLMTTHLCSRFLPLDSSSELGRKISQPSVGYTQKYLIQERQMVLKPPSFTLLSERLKTSCTKTWFTFRLLSSGFLGLAQRGVERLDQMAFISSADSCRSISVQLLGSQLYRSRGFLSPYPGGTLHLTVLAISIFRFLSFSALSLPLPPCGTWLLTVTSCAYLLTFVRCLTFPRWSYRVSGADCVASCRTWSSSGSAFRTQCLYIYQTPELSWQW